MKKGLTILIVLILSGVLLVAMLPSCAKAPPAEEEFETLVIGTKEAGSSSYSTCVPIASVVTKKLPFSVTVEPAGGGEMCLPYMERGEIHMSSISAGEAGILARGLFWREEIGPKPWLRVICNTYETVHMWVVPGDSPIKSYEDMEGKKLACYASTFPPGGVYTDLLLERAGVKNWTKVQATSVGGLCNELVEGRADVAYSTLSSRLLAVEASPRGMSYIPTTQADVDYVNTKLGGEICKLLEREAGYLGLKTITETTSQLGLGEPVTLSGHKDVPEGVVYQFVKAVYESYDEYKDAYAKCKSLTPDCALTSFPIPYHPGAIKYFKEIGIWTAEHDAMQKKLLGEFDKLGK